MDNDLVNRLTNELANFEEIAKYLIPSPATFHDSRVLRFTVERSL